MPEALETLFSAENMPDIAEETRASVKIAVLKIEGSSRDSGMTCIAKNEFPRVTDRLRQEMAKGNVGRSGGSLSRAFAYERPYLAEQKLHGFLRGLNRHCDECSSDCEDRVALSRREINQISGMAENYINPRQAKVQKKKLRVIQESGVSNEV